MMNWCFLWDQQELAMRHYELWKRTLNFYWRGKHPLSILLNEAWTKLFLNFASFRSGKSNRILNGWIESVLWMTDSNFSHPRVCHLFQLQWKVYLYTFAFQCKYNLLNSSTMNNQNSMIFDDIHWEVRFVRIQCAIQCVFVCVCVCVCVCTSRLHVLAFVICDLWFVIYDLWFVICVCVPWVPEAKIA